MSDGRVDRGDGRPAPDGEGDPGFGERAHALAERAHQERAAFDPPEDPPDPDRAMGYLREGLAEAVSLYVDVRTTPGGRLSAGELDALHSAVNDWLELYARCHGAVIDAEFSAREVAELVVGTHDIGDTAQLLTHVPERTGRGYRSE